MPAEQGQTASAKVMKTPVLNGVPLVSNLHQSLLDQKLLSKVKEPQQSEKAPLLNDGPKVTEQGQTAFHMKSLCKSNESSCL